MSPPDESQAFVCRCLWLCMCLSLTLCLCLWLWLWMCGCICVFVCAVISYASPFECDKSVCSDIVHACSACVWVDSIRFAVRMCQVCVLGFRSCMCVNMFAYICV
jgi:hypothetical protein